MRCASFGTHMVLCDFLISRHEKKRYVKPAFAHILALIPPSVVAPTPELSISTEENSETMPVAQPVAPAKSIKTIFQRASEKKMEDDRLTRSFDGDDEQQMDCSLDGPSPSQRAQVRSIQVKLKFY